MRIGTALAAAAIAAKCLLPPAAAPEQWWQTQWRMDEVWAITKGAGVTVAVIDSGVDASMSELRGAVLAGTDLGQGGDGRIDRDREHYHGTRMAIMIASRGGQSGLVGVAPESRILPIAVPIETTEHRHYFSQAIRWAADHGAQVISISLGHTGAGFAHYCPDEVAQAVRYALERDSIVVAAAGNMATGPSEYPGACPGVLSVGATDRQLNPWTGTHQGEYVDVAGPGVDIPTVGPQGLATATGTSDAAALVSGAIALVRAKYPAENARQIITRVLATARDVGAAGRDNQTGVGIVRPYQALTSTIPIDAPNHIFAELEEWPAGLPAELPSGPPERSPLRMIVIAAAAAAVIAAVAGLLAARRRT